MLPVPVALAVLVVGSALSGLPAPGGPGAREVCEQDLPCWLGQVLCWGLGAAGLVGSPALGLLAAALPDGFGLPKEDLRRLAEEMSHWGACPA